jgi:hypothetical protein
MQVNTRLPGTANKIGIVKRDGLIRDIDWFRPVNIKEPYQATITL